jgi:FkbM family methyltransferase
MKTILVRFKIKLLKIIARIQFLLIRSSSQDVMIDCGANIGIVTKRLCKGGAKVYAFEPNPFAFELLNSKFSEWSNVNCIPKGVGVENSKLRLYLHEKSDENEVKFSTGSSLLDFKGNIAKEKYVYVEIIDLCEFIDSLNKRIKILKIDIEGAECKLLIKMINLGTYKKVDYIFVETHDDKIPELKTETDTIRDLIREKNIKNINLNWV